MVALASRRVEVGYYLGDLVDQRLRAGNRHGDRIGADLFGAHLESEGRRIEDIHTHRQGYLFEAFELDADGARTLFDDLDAAVRTFDHDIRLVHADLGLGQVYLGATSSLASGRSSYSGARLNVKRTCVGISPMMIIPSGWLMTLMGIGSAQASRLVGFSSLTATVQTMMPRESANKIEPMSLSSRRSVAILLHIPGLVGQDAPDVLSLIEGAQHAGEPALAEPADHAPIVGHGNDASLF